MKLEALKNFFNPDAEKLVLMFIIDFFFTFILLLAADSLGDWAYLLSPNSLYLVSTIRQSSTIQDIAFHGSVSNFIDVFYLYFLSCLIVSIQRKVMVK
jgi:hypothetical protein